MSDLDILSNKILRLGSLMILDCYDQSTIGKQIITISDAVLELDNIKSDLQSTLTEINTEIARLDAIRFTKAVVGIGLLLVGHSNSSNNNSIIHFSSKLSEKFGKKLLKGAILDENHLREIQKNIISLIQMVDIFIHQGIWLKEVASQSLLKVNTISNVQDYKYFQDVSSLATEISNLSFRIRFNFSFSQIELMQQQIIESKLVIEQLTQIKNKLSKIFSLTDEKQLFDINYTSINYLLSIFGTSIQKIAFNSKSKVIIYMNNQECFPPDILQECERYKTKIINLLKSANSLYDLISDCLNDREFLKIINNLQSKITIDELQEKIISAIRTSEMRLNFEDIPAMKENLHLISKLQINLRNVYKQLELLMKKIDKKSGYLLSTDVVKVLFGLLGKAITGLGLDDNGVIILYNQSDHESVESVIGKCTTLKDKIEKPILQLSFLISFGKECIQNSSLINVLEKKQYAKSITHIKDEIKVKSHIIKRHLNFSKEDIIREQIRKIKIMQESLTQINKNLLCIITNTSEGKGLLYIKPPILQSYLLVFGKIRAVEFNQENELIIDFINKREKASDILKFSQKLQLKVDNLINEAELKLNELHNCLSNPTLLKQRQNEQRKRDFQIKFIISVSTVTLTFSGLFFGWRLSSQEQVLKNAEILMSTVGDVTQAKDIDKIKLMQDKIKKIIGLLETIPNSLLSPYADAQNDIAKFRIKLDIVEKKLKTEEDAVTNLEDAKKLAINADTLAQDSQQLTTSLSEASNKWEQAISLLESIPQNSFITKEAKLNIEKYRANQAKISVKISNEVKAFEALEKAKKLSWEAAIITQKPPHSNTIWNQARVKIGQAILLLEMIPKNSPLYMQEQKRVKEYRDNYDAISQRSIVEEKAVASFNQAQNLAKQVENIAQNTPYTLVNLQDALVKIREAIHLLNSISSGTTTSAQASEAVQIYSRNYNTVYNKFQAVKSCSLSQSNYCLDANYSFSLESIDVNPPVPTNNLPDSNSNSPDSRDPFNLNTDK